MLLSLSLLALLSSHAVAQEIGDVGVNVTVSFFTEDSNESCQNGEYDAGIIFTTGTVPHSFTCFNLDDLFGSNSTDVGFTDADRNITATSGELENPNGVHWRLANRDEYQPDSNYSRVWWQQSNMSETQAGEDARWVLHFYAYEDCEQQQLGDEREPEDYPWFETSCQTEENGQCQTVPNSIRSFGINSAVGYNQGHGQCEEWAFLGGASGMMPGRSTMLAMAAGLVAVLGLM